MGSVRSNDSLYAACIDCPQSVIDLSIAQCFGSPDRSPLLKHLAMDFLPAESLNQIPDFGSWLDVCVDYLSTRDVHYTDAPTTIQ